MASSDLRDVLNIPDGGAGPRPNKKQKLSASRPNLKGLAREVHNLGGDNPIAIVPEVTQFKKRRFLNRKKASHWELRPFRNSARDDQSLVLRHWRRVEAKEAPNETQAEEPQQGETAEQPKEEELEDSAFAKFNVKVPVPNYSEEQYQKSLQNDGWSKEETDYLLGMARDYDLRWPIIWDRYEWNPPATNGTDDADGDESKAVVPTTHSRSVEDLKARYYNVAAKMMAAQKQVQYMTPPEAALHDMMAKFNPQHEKMRKEFAMNSLARSPEEAREEESLLLEVKRILARSERFNEERRELYNRLDYPHAETDINSFKSSTGLQTLLQNLMTVDKSKKRKLMGADGSSPATAAGAGAATAAAAAASQSNAQEAGRRDSGATPAANTKEAATATATPASNSGAASTNASGANNKKGKQDVAEPRKLTPHEEAIYGITHHERLSGGVTFRTEKINKLFSHKSNQQQLRINNTLNELEVPGRLAMPTVGTTQQYEQLLAAVNALLDARKVTDKIDAELKLEQAKKTEREKALAPPAEDGDNTNDAAAKKEGEGQADDAAVAASAEGEEKAEAEKDDNPEKPAEAQDAADAAKEDKEDKAGQDAQDEAPETQGEEDDKDGRPSSSGGPPHKRSASVLSAVSDKSAKRQKK